MTSFQRPAKVDLFFPYSHNISLRRSLIYPNNEPLSNKPSYRHRKHTSLSTSTEFEWLKPRQEAPCMRNPVFDAYLDIRSTQIDVSAQNDSELCVTPAKSYVNPRKPTIISQKRPKTAVGAKTFYATSTRFFIPERPRSTVEQKVPSNNKGIVKRNYQGWRFRRIRKANSSQGKEELWKSLLINSQKKMILNKLQLWPKSTASMNQTYMKTPASVRY